MVRDPLLGRAQPVIPPNIISNIISILLFMNIKAWGPQVSDPLLYIVIIYIIT